VGQRSLIYHRRSKRLELDSQPLRLKSCALSQTWEIRLPKLILAICTSMDMVFRKTMLGLGVSQDYKESAKWYREADKFYGKDGHVQNKFNV